MNIQFIAPYQLKQLKAIEALEKIGEGKISIIGDFAKISACVKENRLKINTKVINIEAEEDIYLYLNEKGLSNEVLVFGDISSSYQKKICGENNELDNFYILDLPELRHFIFVCNHSQRRRIQIEEKKKGIISMFKFMNSLGIRKANVALITDQMGKSDILESNLIRMILRDELSKKINILDPCKLSDCFSPKTPVNVFNKNINMLVFKNYDKTKTFIDTLSVFSESKIATITSSNNRFVICTSDQKDEQDILFSILLVSKYLMTSKVKYANA